MAIQADVSKPDDIKRLFAETKAAYGKLDVLVNNAGVYEFSPLEAITAEHFHKQFNLNVLGLLLTTQEAVKSIGPAGGSIINISSIVGPMPVRTAAVYIATKAAVDGVLRDRRRRLGHWSNAPPCRRSAAVVICSTLGPRLQSAQYHLQDRQLPVSNIPRQRILRRRNSSCYF
jgi:NAD(P)-dependent dehydrogenase (short-subunit alcohol dehydrogenase family)